MKFKKILAVTVTAVMTAAMLLIPASAESIANTAKSRKSGESFSIKLNDASNHDYKVKLTKGGDLKISLTAAVADTDIYLFDSDGKQLLASSKSSSAASGSIYVSSYNQYAECTWNSTMEKFKGTVVYKELDKGTYYIRIKKRSSYTSYSGQGKTSIKFTFPGETAEESGSSETKASPSLAVTVKAGKTLPLSVADADGTVTWTSSKTSVAEVDKNGKVTAKKAGTATITAETGKTTLKIEVVVL